LKVSPFGIVIVVGPLNPSTVRHHFVVDTAGVAVFVGFLIDLDYAKLQAVDVLTAELSLAHLYT
jgi:hypothetical protein